MSDHDGGACQHRGHDQAHAERDVDQERPGGCSESEQHHRQQAPHQVDAALALQPEEQAEPDAGGATSVYTATSSRITGSTLRS